MTARPSLTGPLVVSLVAESFAGFSTALDLGAAADADLVEFRLDHVADALLESG